MTSVTYPGYAGGATYTDDADPATGMGRGGHRERLLPMLAAAVAVAAHADETATHVDTVAAGVVSAPGTQASSTTSMSVGVGARALTAEPGKAFVVGMPVRLAAGAATYMDGVVTAYNASTGALTVQVSVASGSGTYAAWSVMLTGRQSLPDAAGHEGERLRVLSGAPAWAALNPAEALAGAATVDLSAGDVALAASALTTQRITVCSADWRSLRLPPASTLPAGLEYLVINDTLRPVALRDAAGKRVGSVPPLAQTDVRLLDPAGPVWTARGATLHPCAELIATASGVSVVRAAQLGATKALVAWLAGTTLSVAVATVTAGVVTLGGVATIATGATTVWDIDLAGLSATDGAIVWAELAPGSVYRARCAALTVSGTTVTAGTQITVGALTPSGSGLVRAAVLDSGRIVVVRAHSSTQCVLTTVGISAGTASAYSDSSDTSTGYTGLTLTAIDATRVVLTSGNSVRVVTCSGTAAPAVSSTSGNPGLPTSAAYDGAGGVLFGYEGATQWLMRAEVSGTAMTLSLSGAVSPLAPGLGGGAVALARIGAGDVAALVLTYADHSQSCRVRNIGGAPDAVARAAVGRITARTAMSAQSLCALSSGLLLLAAPRMSDNYPVLTPIEVTP